MPKVLVVDDSPMDRALIEGILKKDSRMKIRTAKDGSEALGNIGVELPDVVITDLQMPELDGLQLVTAMRLHYPRVPVILITAHGSEELAIQALEHGAASYVPKSQLAGRLHDVVDQVLALVRAERSYELLGSCMDYVEFRFTLDNDPETTSPVVELLQQLAGSMGICGPGTQLRLGMALEEAIRACMLRGNLEMRDGELLEYTGHDDESALWLARRSASERCRGRKLRLSARLSPQQAEMELEHDGPPLALHLPAAETVSAGLEAPSDRSVILMQAFMDEVEFSGDGRRIRLVKRQEKLPR
ncbi:MAG: response regulator [Pirellulaceae bacterium]